MAINAEGANYFGAFGVGYRIGVGLPFFRSAIEAESTITSNDPGEDHYLKFFLPIQMNAQLSGRFRHFFMENFAIEAGLGLNYSLGISEDAEVKYLFHRIAISTDIGVQYSLSDLFALRGGINFSVSVFRTMVPNDPTEPTEMNYGNKAVLTPYVGIVVKY